MVDRDAMNQRSRAPSTVRRLKTYASAARNVGLMLCCVSLIACGRSGLAGGGLSGTSSARLALSLDTPTAYPGMHGLVIRVTVVNGAVDPIVIDIPDVGFNQQGVDAAHFFQQASPLPSPEIILGDSEVSYELTYSVSEQIPTGAVLVEGMVDVQTFSGRHVNVDLSAATVELRIGATSEVRVVSVRSPSQYVVPGQQGVPVQIAVENFSAQSLSIGRTGLSFFRGSENIDELFTLGATAASPTVLAPQSVTTLDLWVDVSAANSVGPVRVEPRIEVNHPDTGATIVDAREQKMIWEIRQPGELRGLLVEARRSDVYPGQEAVPLWLVFENTTDQRISNVELTLLFSRGGSDVSEQFPPALSTLDLASTIDVDPGLSRGVVLYVDVSPVAAEGLVWIDAAISGQAESGATGFAQIGSMTVRSREVLLVTTAVDEDDTAGTPTVVGAGGLDDLSLREAIIIANNSPEPMRVQFDSGVFPLLPPTTLTLDPTLGDLPGLSAEGMSLDGVGAGVVISGGGMTVGVGLDVIANDVTVTGVAVENFLFGVRVQADKGANIVDVSAQNCGAGSVQSSDASSGANFYVMRGAGHVLNRIDSRGSNHWGLYIDSAASGMQLSESVITSNLRAVNISGTGHQLSNFRAEASRWYGVDLRGADHVELNGCSVKSNRSTGESARNHGIRVDSTSYACSIKHCSFGNNRNGNILMKSGSHDIAVIGGRFEHNTAAPLDLEVGVNGDLLPPQIDAVADAAVAGTSSVEGGWVQVYGGTTDRLYLGGGQVVNGDWRVDLPRTYTEVSATVTSLSGSTSIFSPIAFLKPIPLIVNTSDDELDGGVAMNSLDEASGGTGLSLREAIHIANNRPGPTPISFDPIVFAPGTSAPIVIGAGNAGGLPLPALTRTGISISADGALVDLVTGEQQLPAGSNLLDVLCDGCVVSGLGLGPDAPPSGAALHVGGGGARFSDLRIRCGNAISVGIDTAGSADAIIENSSIENCLAGASLNGQRTHIVDCDFFGFSQDAIQIGGAGQSRDNVIQGSIFHGASHAGVSMQRDAIRTTVLGCISYDNGSSGIYTGIGSGYGTGAELHHNIVYNNPRGFELPQAAGVVLHNNIIMGNHVVGVDRDYVGGNNLFFDNGGDGITGANAVTGVDAASLRSTDIIADPELSDIAGGNFLPGDAVRDQGADLGYDRNGSSSNLFNGLAPDIGPVELQ